VSSIQGENVAAAVRNLVGSYHRHEICNEVPDELGASLMVLAIAIR